MSSLRNAVLPLPLLLVAACASTPKSSAVTSSESVAAQPSPLLGSWSGAIRLPGSGELGIQTS